MREYGVFISPRLGSPRLLLLPSSVRTFDCRYACTNHGAVARVPPARAVSPSTSSAATPMLAARMYWNLRITNYAFPGVMRDLPAAAGGVHVCAEAPDRT